MPYDVRGGDKRDNGKQKTPQELFKERYGERIKLGIGDKLLLRKFFEKNTPTLSEEDCIDLFVREYFPEEKGEEKSLTRKEIIHYIHKHGLEVFLQIFFSISRHGTKVTMTNHKAYNLIRWLEEICRQAKEKNESLEIYREHILIMLDTIFREMEHAGMHPITKDDFSIHLQKNNELLT